MPASAQRWSSVLMMVVIALLAAASLACAARFLPAPGVALPAAVGAAWGDYDDDGYPDVFIGAASGEQLLHNNGDGTFTDVAAAAGLDATATDARGCAWGDYDNDGQLDLVVMRLDHPLQLYHNGGGHFTDVAATAGLALSGRVGAGVAWGDYDADNWLDLFVCYNDETGSALYRNGHDGTFTDVTEAALPANTTSYGLQPAWADRSKNGWPDVMMSRQSGTSTRPSTFFRNLEDGTFGATGVAPQDSDHHSVDATSVAWGDYNNDLVPDLFVGTNVAGTWSCLDTTYGTGSFSRPPLDGIGLSAMYGPVHGAAWADYDNDGMLDLAGGPAPGAVTTLLLCRNDGDGTFTESASAEGLSGAALFNALCWGDFDRDGRLDLLAAGDDVSTLYRNTGAVGEGHHLRVRALTSASGDATDGGPVRDALGATVLVNLDNDPGFPPTGRTIMRVIDGGSGYFAQNEPVAEFGLGAATQVAVLVNFVDGAIVRQSDVAADQPLEVREVPQSFGSITGKVTAAVLGYAVQEAYVSVAGRFMPSYTGATGEYTVTRVPAGSGYTVNVTCSNYDYYPAAVGDVTVVAGQTTTVDVVLDHPMGTLTGTVRDSDTDEPIGGAFISADPRGPGPGHPGVGTQTAADGTYVIPGLFPTTYEVSAFKRGYWIGIASDVVVAQDQTTTTDFALTEQVPPDPYIVTDPTGRNITLNGDSSSPAITPDGRFIAFTSEATNLTPDATSGESNVFLLDRETYEFTRISRAPDGSEPNDSCYRPSVSADGRFVAFSSTATNLLPEVTTPSWYTYVYDRDTDILTLGTRAGDGALPNADCEGQITADGRCLVFRSYATNLMPGEQTPAEAGLHRRDLQTGQLARVDVAVDGGLADGEPGGSSVTPDGRYIAFNSYATNLVPDDTNGIVDTFVRDMTAGQTERVSVASDGSEALGHDISDTPSVSGDGRYVTFTSGGDNLIPGLNSRPNVLLRDRVQGTTEVVSIDLSGNALASPYFGSPDAVSADGRLVAFSIVNSNDLEPIYRLYVRDREAAVTAPTNRRRNGPAVLSDNGRYLVWPGTLGSDRTSLWLWEPCLQTFGTLTGTVTDADTGAPVPHAGVWIGEDLFTTAQADGTFTIDVAVTPGTTVKAFADGYGPVTQTAAVTEGEVTRVDFTLLYGFPDVAADNWARQSILACVDAGIVSGYPDGTYRPDEAVNRGQMAVYIARALAGGDAQVPTPPADATFSDVPVTGYGDDGTEAHWAYPYVECCAAEGIVQGYWDGTYRPDEVVNRGAMAVYVARAVAGGDAAVPADTDGAAFTDVTEANDWSWCYRYVEYCATNGIVQGYPDGTYRPQLDVTRDQMAVYVARAFGLPV
jgi:Tol biopolymer transport system component